MCTRAVSSLRSVRSQIMQGPNARVEQSLNFSPYHRKTNPKATVTVKFFCLANMEENRVPTTTMERMLLKDANLGYKEITMSSLASTKEMKESLIEHYPELALGGGFEFLKCTANSRDLECIPSYCLVSPKHLKAYIGNGHVYIRPLQRNLGTKIAVHNRVTVRTNLRVLC